MRGSRSGAGFWLPVLLAGCAAGAHHEAHGPEGIPYVCADGRPARVVHEGGGDPLRARARLLFDGRTIEMRGAATEAGLRYTTEAEEGVAHVLVWSEAGEEARLSEVPLDQAGYGEGREIVRCSRLRSAEGETPEDGHDTPDH